MKKPPTITAWLFLWLQCLEGVTSWTLNHSPRRSCSWDSVRVSVTTSTTTQLRSSDEGAWTGEVVSNSDGRIRGCTITQVTDSLTEWEVQIDGVEADLGQFSDAIHRKIVGDAKQQRYQGFRPGTVPPHLQPTFRLFAMDEAAREAALEALQQNNIRPFESTRVDLTIENVSIPPPSAKKGKKHNNPNKKKNQKKKGMAVETTDATETSSSSSSNSEEEEPPAVVEVWTTHATPKDAVDAGWQPGQSFSFVAKNVKGQQLVD